MIPRSNHQSLQQLQSKRRDGGQNQDSASGGGHKGLYVDVLKPNSGGVAAMKVDPSCQNLEQMDPTTVKSDIRHTIQRNQLNVRSVDKKKKKNIPIMPAITQDGSPHLRAPSGIVGVTIGEASHGQARGQDSKQSLQMRDLAAGTSDIGKHDEFNYILQYQEAHDAELQSSQDLQIDNKQLSQFMKLENSKSSAKAERNDLLNQASKFGGFADVKQRLPQLITTSMNREGTGATPLGHLDPSVQQVASAMLLPTAQKPQLAPDRNENDDKVVHAMATQANHKQVNTASLDYQDLVKKQMKGKQRYRSKRRQAKGLLESIQEQEAQLQEGQNYTGPPRGEVHLFGDPRRRSKGQATKLDQRSPQFHNSGTGSALSGLLPSKKDTRASNQFSVLSRNSGQNGKIINNQSMFALVPARNEAEGLSIAAPSRPLRNADHRCKSQFDQASQMRSVDTNSVLKLPVIQDDQERFKHLQLDAGPSGNIKEHFSGTSKNQRESKVSFEPSDLNSTRPRHLPRISNDDSREESPSKSRNYLNQILKEQLREQELQLRDMLRNQGGDFHELTQSGSSEVSGRCTSVNKEKLLDGYGQYLVNYAIPNDPGLARAKNDLVDIYRKQIGKNWRFQKQLGSFKKSKSPKSPEGLENPRKDPQRGSVISDSTDQKLIPKDSSATLADNQSSIMQPTPSHLSVSGNQNQASNAELRTFSRSKGGEQKTSGALSIQELTTFSEHVVPKSLAFTPGVYGDATILTEIFKIARKKRRETNRSKRYQTEETVFSKAKPSPQSPQNSKSALTKNQSQSPPKSPRSPKSTKPSRQAKQNKPSSNSPKSSQNEYPGNSGLVRNPKSPEDYEEELIQVISDDYSDVRIRRNAKDSEHTDAQKSKNRLAEHRHHNGSMDSGRAVDPNSKTDGLRQQNKKHSGKLVAENGLVADEMRDKAWKFVVNLQRVGEPLTAMVQEEKDLYQQKVPELEDTAKRAAKKPRNNQKSNKKQKQTDVINSPAAPANHQFRRHEEPSSLSIHSQASKRGAAISAISTSKNNTVPPKLSSMPNSVSKQPSGLLLVPSEQSSKRQQRGAKPANTDSNVLIAETVQQLKDLRKIKVHGLKPQYDNSQFEEQLNRFQINRESVIWKYQNRMIEQFNAKGVDDNDFVSEEVKEFKMRSLSPKSKRGGHQSGNGHRRHASQGPLSDRQGGLEEKHVCSQVISQLLLSDYIDQNINQKSRKQSPTEQAQESEKSLILKQALIDQGDMDLFGQKVTKTNTQEKMLNDYLLYLTNGSISNEMIFNLCKNINKKIQRDLISKFNQKDTVVIDSLVAAVIERVKYKDMCVQSKKNATIAEDKFQNHQPGNHSYFMACEQEKSLALPIFQKVQDKKLILLDYQLNTGLCKAMAEGFKKQPRILNELHFENCGLNDKQTAAILEGAAHLEGLRSFVARYQEFGEESVRALAKVLEAPFPNQLQELKIITCKISSTDLEQLLENLIERNSFIQNLVLMKVSFSAPSLRLLCQYIEGSCFLRQLDVSWCELRSSQYEALLDSLCENTQLEELNLSHNKLQSKNASNEQVEALYQRLKNIVINNQSLIHLFLNNCDLSYEVIRRLLPYFEKSPSLAAVHLSNNEGITPEAKEEFRRILHREGPRQGQAEGPRQQATSPTSAKNLQFEQLLDTGIQNEQSNKEMTIINRELIQAKKMRRERDVLTSYLRVQDGFAGRIFIMQRIIGFDEQLVVSRPTDQTEAPEGTPVRRLPANDPCLCPPSQWRAIESGESKCWVCDRHIYAVIFWNQEIGKLVNLNIKQKEAVIEQLTPLPYRTNRPVLYTFQNGWMGQEMHTISEFCFTIDKRKGREFDETEIPQIRDLEFNDPEEIEREKNKYPQRYKLYHKLHQYKKVERFRDTIHRNLDYRDPQFVNGYKVCLLQMDLVEKRGETNFALPQFLQTGRFSYVIEYPQGEFYFHKGLIHFRKEDIPVKLQDKDLEYEQKDVKKSFDINHSFFKDMHQDLKLNELKIDQCIAHDLRNITPRIPSFLGDSKEKARFCAHVIEDHFDALRYAYQYALSEASHHNGIDLDAFLNFCFDVCGVQTVTQNFIIDQFDEATKIVFVNGQKPMMRDQSKPIDLLCRKEFFEVILRIGPYEYPDQPFAPALEMFIQKNLIQRVPQHLGQKWRENELWTKDVSDLLKVNEYLFNMVFAKYKQRMTFDCLIKIFMIDSRPRMAASKQDIIRAVAFSKQLVARDFESEYKELSLFSNIEFYEIFARVVDLQSRGTTTEFQFLHRKIEMMLNQLVKLGGRTNEAQLLSSGRTLVVDWPPESDHGESDGYGEEE